MNRPGIILDMIFQSMCIFVIIKAPVTGSMQCAVCALCVMSSRELIDLMADDAARTGRFVPLDVIGSGNAIEFRHQCLHQYWLVSSNIWHVHIFVCCRVTNTLSFSTRINYIVSHAMDSCNEVHLSKASAAYPQPTWVPARVFSCPF
jgi:hypothetical protein